MGKAGQVVTWVALPAAIADAAWGSGLGLTLVPAGIALDVSARVRTSKWLSFGI